MDLSKKKLKKEITWLRNVVTFNTLTSVYTIKIVKLSGLVCGINETGLWKENKRLIQFLEFW